MTLDEVTDAISTVFAPYSIPVVSGELTPVKPPAIIVGGATRNRGTACWEKSHAVTVVAGRMDDVDVEQRLDVLSDTFCRLITSKVGLVNPGNTNTAGVRTIGDVDYLADVFQVTAYELGPGLVLPG